MDNKVDPRVKFYRLIGIKIHPETLDPTVPGHNYFKALNLDENLSDTDAVKAVKEATTEKTKAAGQELFEKEKRGEAKDQDIEAASDAVKITYRYRKVSSYQPTFTDEVAKARSTYQEGLKALQTPAGLKAHRKTLREVRKTALEKQEKPALKHVGREAAEKQLRSKVVSYGFPKHEHEDVIREVLAGVKFTSTPSPSRPASSSTASAPVPPSIPVPGVGHGGGEKGWAWLILAAPPIALVALGLLHFSVPLSCGLVALGTLGWFHYKTRNHGFLHWEVSCSIGLAMGLAVGLFRLPEPVEPVETFDKVALQNVRFPKDAPLKYSLAKPVLLKAVPHRASSEGTSFALNHLCDADPTTSWAPGFGETTPWITMAFQGERIIDGIALVNGNPQPAAAGGEARGLKPINKFRLEFSSEDSIEVELPARSGMGGHSGRATGSQLDSHGSPR